MNILYFSPTCLSTHNGIVRRLTETARLFRQMGDAVLIVAPRGSASLPAALEQTVLTIKSLPFPGYRGFTLGLPYWDTLTQAQAEAFRPDLVHVLDPVAGTAWLGYRFARQHQLPLVASYHTHLSHYLPYYGLQVLNPLLWHCLQYQFERASLLLCPSESTRAMLLSHLPGTRFHLWAGGVDSDLFHPNKREAAFRERLTTGHPRCCVLLSAGRLALEKNLEDLFFLLPRLPGCHLAVVGDGPAASKLKRLAAQLPVTFLGPLQGEELAYAYASADLFVQPSGTETFGNATLEAMASGLPVVARDAGGSRDLLTHEHNGLLYSELDEAIQAIRRLQTLPVWRAALGTAARKTAEQRSWWVSTRALRQHYSSLLQAPLSHRSKEFAHE